MSKKEKLIKTKDLLLVSWQVYSKNVFKFIEVLVYGLLGLVPLIVLMVLVLLYARTLSSSASVTVNVILGILAFLAFLASLCIAIFYSVRSKIASILLIKNDFTAAKKNFTESKKYFVRFFGVSLLLVVLVIAWGFALVIPALIFAIYYGFAQYVLVVENKRPFSAVERSFDLVRGYFWPVFGRLTVVLLIGIFIYVIISFPINKINQSSFLELYSIFVNIFWAVISPYFLVYSYKLYDSLKETNK